MPRPGGIPAEDGESAQVLLAVEVQPGSSAPNQSSSREFHPKSEQGFQAETGNRA